MSLISVKNLALPFNNRVHIVTIILVGIVFALFRMTTGAVDKQPYAPAREQPRAQAVQQEPAKQEVAESSNSAVQAKEKVSKPVPPKPSRVATDLLKELAGSQPAQEAPKDLDQAEDQTQGGALGDVEKQLGLR